MQSTVQCYVITRPSSAVVSPSIPTTAVQTLVFSGMTSLATHIKAFLNVMVYRPIPAVLHAYYDSMFGNCSCRFSKEQHTYTFSRFVLLSSSL